MKAAALILALVVIALALIEARYTIEASGPGAIWQLDRITGAVRLCPPSEPCREWSRP